MSDQSNTEHDDETEPSEFDKFEELTRKLLTVPKSELDKLRNRPA